MKGHQEVKLYVIKKKRLEGPTIRRHEVKTCSSPSIKTILMMYKWFWHTYFPTWEIHNSLTLALSIPFRLFTVHYSEIKKSIQTLPTIMFIFFSLLHLKLTEYLHMKMLWLWERLHHDGIYWKRCSWTYVTLIMFKCRTFEMVIAWAGQSLFKHPLLVHI
jgi:hypothetical protein